MSTYVCITVRFLQPLSHGRRTDSEPEWPPSPLRLLQALIAAAAGKWNERQDLKFARLTLKWFETSAPPQIISPRYTTSNAACVFYVPDNTADLNLSAWSKGETANQVKRTEKIVRAVYVEDGAVFYIFDTSSSPFPDIEVLRAAARSITHLGWGIDMAIGDANLITDEEAANLQGIRWTPSPAGGTPLRTPKPGTLDDLCRKHTAFLNRLSGECFRPVPPLRVFDIVRYRRQDEPLTRPFQLFELHEDARDALFRYPQAKLIHIAGMVRHLAIEAMTHSPPPGMSRAEAADWVDSYVAGHRRGAGAATKGTDLEQPATVAERKDLHAAHEHRQLSYLPLPSIGHRHTDPSVRRVLISAPPGDDSLLRHLAQRLDGLKLIPTPRTHLKDPPRLKWVRSDSFVQHYVERSRLWASVTPVILPGHDDHKAEKTRKLILKALAQSGVEQPCTFEWSAFSRFPHSLSAHKYDRDQRRVGYWRPDHLEGLSAVHVRLEFAAPVPGPLSIGAGRHCGLGLLAPEK